MPLATHVSRSCENVQFHLWFLGYQSRPKWERLILAIIALIVDPLKYAIGYWPAAILEWFPKLLLAATLSLLLGSAISQTDKFSISLFFMFLLVINLKEARYIIEHVIFNLIDVILIGYPSLAFARGNLFVAISANSERTYEFKNYLVRSRPTPNDEYGQELLAFNFFVDRAAGSEEKLRTAILGYWEADHDLKTYWQDISRKG